MGKCCKRWKERLVMETDRILLYNQTLIMEALLQLTSQLEGPSFWTESIRSKLAASVVITNKHLDETQGISDVLASMRESPVLGPQLAVVEANLHRSGAVPKRLPLPSSGDENTGKELT